MSVMKRIVLVMQYDAIEPLGVMHLAGLARMHGVDARIVLHRNFDFEPLRSEIASFKPEMVGFSIWTGAHLPCFAEADRILRMGIPVAVGGPHATYFPEQCTLHATWTVIGDGYRPLRRILYGELEPGIHFDENAMAEGWPAPYRDQVYADYPDLRDTPMFSQMLTKGCVYKCTYCNSPYLNRMYKRGFKDVYGLQPLDQVIRDARDARDRFGKTKPYFQDDIAFFDIEGNLKPFRDRWRSDVGLSFHCQMRPEMMKADGRGDRLALIREAGGDGVTIAIESGDPFIREFVLQRSMAGEVITSGIERAAALGFSLRSEQIYQKPGDTEETDLQTLLLNNRMRKWVTMMWVSRLVPFGETSIGRMARKLGCYDGDNDRIVPMAYDQKGSLLRHIEGGFAGLEPAVRSLVPLFRTRDEKSPLVYMHARPKRQGGNVQQDPVVDVHLDRDVELGITSIGGLSSGRLSRRDGPVGEIRFREPDDNHTYDEVVTKLQRTSLFLARVPNVGPLARRWMGLPVGAWTWPVLGQLTETHMREQGYGDRIEGWTRELADGLHCGVDALPRPIAENPLYFCFFASGPGHARELLEKGTLDKEPDALFDELRTLSRRWSFTHEVYKIRPATPRIADV